MTAIQASRRSAGTSAIIGSLMVAATVALAAMAPSANAHTVLTKKRATAAVREFARVVAAESSADEFDAYCTKRLSSRRFRCSDSYTFYDYADNTMKVCEGALTVSLLRTPPPVRVRAVPFSVRCD
jgi:hypothetical protein